MKKKQLLILSTPKKERSLRKKEGGASHAILCGSEKKKGWQPAFLGEGVNRGYVILTASLSADAA